MSTRRILVSALLLAALLLAGAEGARPRLALGDQSMACQFCQSLINFVRSGTTRDKFELFLLSRCERYFDQDAQQLKCENFIKQHMDEIMRESPLEVCKIYQVC